MKIITPSHNLIAAVTSSEKFTCPGRSISNHAFHIPNLRYLLIANASGDKNCNYFVILVSYFCDGLFYQIFRNHIIQLCSYKYCAHFSWEVEKETSQNYC